MHVTSDLEPAFTQCARAVECALREGFCIGVRESNDGVGGEVIAEVGGGASGAYAEGERVWSVTGAVDELKNQSKDFAGVLQGGRFGGGQRGIQRGHPLVTEKAGHWLGRWLYCRVVS